jgi:hypothetical protein
MVPEAYALLSTTMEAGVNVLMTLVKTPAEVLSTLHTAA